MAVSPPARRIFTMSRTRGKRRSSHVVRFTSTIFNKDILPTWTIANSPLCRRQQSPTVDELLCSFHRHRKNAWQPESRSHTDLYIYTPLIYIWMELGDISSGEMGKWWKPQFRFISSYFAPIHNQANLFGLAKCDEATRDWWAKETQLTHTVPIGHASEFHSRLILRRDNLLPGTSSSWWVARKEITFLIHQSHRGILLQEQYLS